MIIAWDEEAWQDYLWWQNNDKRILRKIHKLLDDIKRNGYSGIGKPEPLKNDLSGWHSRRIDGEHRMVYRIREDRVEIIQCKDHYDD